MTDADLTDPHLITVVIDGDRETFRRGSFGYVMAKAHITAEGRIEALSAELAEAKEEIERLARQLTGARSELDRLDRIKEAMLSSNGRVLRECDALRTEKIAAKRRAASAEAERDALAAQLDGLRAGIAVFADEWEAELEMNRAALREGCLLPYSPPGPSDVRALLGGDESEATAQARNAVPPATRPTVGEGSA